MKIIKTANNLNHAIDTLDVEKVKDAIQRGEVGDDYTFNLTVVNEDPEILKIIINAGYKPKNKEGQNSSMNMAIRMKNFEIIKLVLYAGGTFNEYSVLSGIHTKNLDILNFILDNGAVVPKGLNIDKVLEFGDRKTFQKLLNLGGIFSSNALQIAIRNRLIDLILFLLSLGVKPYSRDLEVAMSSGDLNIVKILLKNGVKVDKEHIQLAIDLNNEELVDLLLKNEELVDLLLKNEFKYYKTDKDYYMLNKCIYSKNINLLTRMIQFGFRFEDKNLSFALDNGDQEVINFVVESLLQDDSNCFDNLAELSLRYGRLDIANLFVDKMRTAKNFQFANPLSYLLNFSLSSFSDIDFIKKLVNLGAEVDSSSLYHVSNKRKINQEVYDFIFSFNPEMRSTYGSKTLNNIIARNDEKNVKKLIDLGSSCNIETMITAINTKNISLIKLIHDSFENSIIGANSAECLNKAIGTGDFEIIKYVHSIGGSLSETTMKRAIYSFDLDIIKYFIDLGIDLTGAMDDTLVANPNINAKATKLKKIEIVKLLLPLVELTQTNFYHAISADDINYDLTRLLLANNCPICDNALSMKYIYGKKDIFLSIWERIEKKPKQILDNYFRIKIFVSDEELQGILSNYSSNFQFGDEIFAEKYICDLISNFTGKKNYDENIFKEKMLATFNRYNVDHRFTCNLKNIYKVLDNQLKFIKDLSGFYLIIDKLAGASEELTKSMKETKGNKTYAPIIEKWILDMSSQIYIANENIFMLASLIPLYYKKQDDINKKIEMEKIFKDNPEKGPQRFKLIKELNQKYDNNIFQYSIKKDDLKALQVEQNNDEYKMLLDEINQITEDIDVKPFLFESVKNLIVHSGSEIEFYDKINFVKEIAGGSSEANIKPEEFNINSGGRNFLFKILEKRDPLGLVIGYPSYSGCCFKINGASESSLKEAYVNPDTGILVVYDDKGRFVAQSWIWLTKDKKSLVLDNVELAQRFKIASDGGQLIQNLYNIFGKKTSNNEEHNMNDIIRSAYKEFANNYKQKTGMSVIVGAGYDSLGIGNMGLQHLTDFNFSTEYPITKNKEIDEIYTDTENYADESIVYRLANWYTKHKYGVR